MFIYERERLTAPQCGFSMAVSNVLKHLNVKFKGVNVLEDQNLKTRNKRL